MREHPWRCIQPLPTVVFAAHPPDPARAGAPEATLREAAEGQLRRRAEARELAVPEPSPGARERLQRAGQEARGLDRPERGSPSPRHLEER